LLAFHPHSAIHIPQLVNDRSNRNLYDFVRRIFAMHFFPAPMSAVFRLNERLVEKMSEMVGMLIGPQNNIAAAPAVTAIRSALGNEFLAPETDAPASALSGLRKNFDAIDKHDERNCHSAHALSSTSKSRTQGVAASKPPTYNKGGLEIAPCISARGSAERRPTKDHRDRELERRDFVEPQIKRGLHSGELV